MRWRRETGNGVPTATAPGEMAVISLTCCRKSGGSIRAFLILPNRRAPKIKFICSGRLRINLLKLGVQTAQLAACRIKSTWD
jgi:hypothetical protein